MCWGEGGEVHGGAHRARRRGIKTRMRRTLGACCQVEGVFVKWKTRPAGWAVCRVERGSWVRGPCVAR